MCAWSLLATKYLPSHFSHLSPPHMHTHTHTQTFPLPSDPIIANSWNILVVIHFGGGCPRPLSRYIKYWYWNVVSWPVQLNSFISISAYIGSSAKYNHIVLSDDLISDQRFDFCSTFLHIRRRWTQQNRQALEAGAEMCVNWIVFSFRLELTGLQPVPVKEHPQPLIFLSFCTVKEAKYGRDMKQLLEATLALATRQTMLYKTLSAGEISHRAQILSLICVVQANKSCWDPKHF